MQDEIAHPATDGRKLDGARSLTLYGLPDFNRVGSQDQFSVVAPECPRVTYPADDDLVCLLDEILEDGAVALGTSPIR